MRAGRHPRTLFLSHNLNRRSGETRAILNLTQGINSLGGYARILAYYAETSVLEQAGEMVTRVTESAHDPTTLGRLPFTFPKHLKVLFERAKSEIEREAVSVVILGSDLLVPAPIHREKVNNAMLLWYSQGADPTLFLKSNRANRPFPWGRALFPAMHNLVSNWVSKMDGVVVNSLYSGQIVQESLGISPLGIVYPPVNDLYFSPSAEDTQANFFLAVGRRQDSSPLLERVASNCYLITVGGLHVRGAQNLGFVSDSEIRRLYATARGVLHFLKGEHYGYPVAEALMMGTPVAAYDEGGPVELIRPGKNGVTTGLDSDPKGIIEELSTVDWDRARIRADARSRFSSAASAGRLEELVLSSSPYRRWTA